MMAVESDCATHIIGTSLSDAVRQLRVAADELEMLREHNRTLFALLAQRDRQIAAARAELMQIRSVLDAS